MSSSFAPIETAEPLGEVPVQEPVEAAPTAQGPAVMRCTISPRKLATRLGLVVGGLAVANTAARLLVAHVGPDRYRGLMQLVRRFDCDLEVTIPTWFSSSLLLCCALVLVAITAARRRAKCGYTIYWAILAAAFFYLSIDETANFHEILIVSLRRRLDAHGFLYFTWVIPGAVMVGAFGLFYLRFLLHLDRRSRNLFVWAGAIYVGGALGVEMIGGAFADCYGLESMPYLAAMTVEETSEMLGCVVFLYALLTYLRTHVGPWQVHLADEAPRDLALRPEDVTAHG